MPKKEKVGPTLMEMKAARDTAFMQMEQAKAVQQQALQQINQITQQINELEKKAKE